ncbi:MAG: right-handed parallel beta-helix repeat-containing protein [Bacteroidota bacterium]
MKTKSGFSNLVSAFRFLFALLLITVAVNGYGQKQTDWRNLLANGANYYDIKAAFEKQHAVKLAEMKSGNAGAGVGAEGAEKAEYSDIRQFMRWAAFTEPRVAESKGDLSLMFEKQKKGMIQANAMKQKRALQGNDNWTLVGPKTQFNSMSGNGRVNRVRVHPTNPNVLYACTPASQLFKSTDGGSSWTSLTDGLPTIGIGDVAIDPSDPNTLYATTGDSDSHHARTAGVYKSTDGGLTWHKLTGLPEPLDFYNLTSIVMNPAVPGSFLVSSEKSIFRFTNSGNTAVKVSDIGGRDLTFMPGNPNIVFAGSYSNSAGPTAFLRSDNNGVTWTVITSGLPIDAYRYAIAVSPVNPNMVYVWTSAQGEHVSQGVYCSTNAGLTFKQMNGGTPNMCEYQGGYNLCLAADLTNAATVYAGGTYVYRSTDTGKTWVNLSQSSPVGHVDIHGITFSGPSTIYIANDGGVYKTTDAGASFTNISSNLTIAQSYGISMSATNKNRMLSGHQDNGTNLSNDLLSWREVLGADGLLSLIDRTNDNIMFGTIQWGKIYRSMNGGASFSQVGLSIPKNILWQTPLVQDPNVPSTIYAGSDKVYKSIDYGTSWTAISPEFHGIMSINVDKNNSDIIYLASYFFLYKTIDGGKNWVSINNGYVAVSQIMNLHIDVNNSDILYLVTASFDKNFYRSVDAGATWSVWADGLPALPARSVVTQLGAKGEVYCGTDHGVYYRNSDSDAWTLYNSNLPPAPVTDLKIFYPTGTLRAATFGRGIWESPLARAAFVCPVVFVDSNATGNNTGESWTNAFNSLQDGIKAASTCGIREIWVAKGTYYPDQGTGITRNNRAAAFNLKTNVSIFGGFAGIETLVSQRNWVANKTTLSGEIGNTNDFGDNSYSVVEVPAVDATALLDGFTITAGNGNANTGVNPASRGGGVYIAENGSPTIKNCVLLKNYAGRGGAIYILSNSHATISNCIFTGNAVTEYGAGIYNRTGSHATIINCSFSGNLETAIDIEDNSSVVVRNSIIWGNSANIYGTGSVSHSIVQGGYDGEGNLDQDPIFVGQPGQVFGATGNLRVQPCSPAIDAGDDLAATSTFDLDGTNRKVNLLPNAALIDIGAYERSGSIATLYVDAAANGKGDGSGWTNAYRSFYEALQVYNGCIAIDSVLIAAGTYMPPLGVPFVVSKTSGVLLGGYPTGGGTRNATSNPVIIKGEMQVKKSMRIDGIKIQ